MEKKKKTAKQMERHLKGVSNHYRIEILMLIDQVKEITLEDIIDKIDGNRGTIGEHTRRLVLAGLVSKKYDGRFVQHALTPYGQFFVRFLKGLEKI